MRKINTVEMTEDMNNAAAMLHDCARRYRSLYEEKIGKRQAAVWVKDETTGETVFLVDDFNAEIIKNRIL